MASPALDREAVDQAVSRGSELLKQGKLDEAQKSFRAALLLDGENPRVLALLGLTHFRAGQFGQARPIYEELVERAPTDASHRLNLGLVYLKLGESDKAIGSLEASRALDPSQGRAVSYLGLAYARAGRYAEAYRSFLLAGQTELANEIEINLTPAERDGIHAQLQRSGVEPSTRPTPPPPPSTTSRSEHSISGFVIERPENISARSTPPTGVPTRPTPPPAPQPRRPAMEESAVAIVIDRPPVQSQVAIPIPRPSEPDIREMEGDPGAPITPATEIQAPRVSDSLQFVLPREEAVPEPAEGQSMISRAVEIASPAAAPPGMRVGRGSAPPVPLSQLATEQLLRPEDGDATFEIAANGALLVRVVERVLTRLDGIHVTGGELEFEPAMRRSRGHQTEDKFSYGGTQLHAVSGQGYLVAIAGEKTFTAVSLDDDILYLREDIVFAFEATLRWENGNVPGLRGKLPVVQFRGDGAVAIRTGKPLVRVKLPAQGVLFVDATRLAGWIGRVIPRAVVPPKHGPMGDVCVECTGEGVVLVDPGEVVPGFASGAEPVARATKPPPPPKPAEIDLGLGDKSDDEI
ncbi:MAG: tetratricopeptide repeat protein [Kofleriaceae bacterium]|nr:tetratricopeptide repeat protein [Kofleriaceae bacterium]